LHGVYPYTEAHGPSTRPKTAGHTAVYTARRRSCNGHLRGRVHGPSDRSVHVRLHGRTRLLHGLVTGMFAAVYASRRRPCTHMHVYTGRKWPCIRPYTAVYMYTDVHGRITAAYRYTALYAARTRCVHCRVTAVYICIRAVYTANGRVRAVYTARTRPFDSRGHGSCTRPCTRPVYKAAYRGRVHARIHGPFTVVYTAV